MEKFRPGSGINIPDPQHCIFLLYNINIDTVLNFRGLVNILIFYNTNRRNYATHTYIQVFGIRKEKKKKKKINEFVQNMHSKVTLQLIYLLVKLLTTAIPFWMKAVYIGCKLFLKYLSYSPHIFFIFNDLIIYTGVVE
jgi:hypothetical protein